MTLPNQVRVRARYWLSETQYNWADWRDGWFTRKVGCRWVDAVIDAQEKILELPLSRALCRVFGHQPMMDQCMIPDHDYCWCCNQRTPGQAIRT